MNTIDIAEHEAWFTAYAERMRSRERENPAPMLLKERHTREVLDNARRIVREEEMPPAQARACLLAALYHDTARFEQYLRFRTFRDPDSFNHGQWGTRILKREPGPLHAEDARTRGVVLAAVGMHNRFALPARLPEDVRIATLVVRDADKLDILRIMEDELSRSGEARRAAVLSLPDTPGIPCPRVTDAILADRNVTYADLRSVNDFRLLMGAWIRDMNFAGSRRRFLETGHALRLVRSVPDDATHGPARAHLLRILEAGA